MAGNMVDRCDGGLVSPERFPETFGLETGRVEFLQLVPLTPEKAESGEPWRREEAPPEDP